MENFKFLVCIMPVSMGENSVFAHSLYRKSLQLSSTTKQNRAEAMRRENMHAEKELQPGTIKQNFLSVAIKYLFPSSHLPATHQRAIYGSLLCSGGFGCCWREQSVTASAGSTVPLSRRWHDDDDDDGCGTHQNANKIIHCLWDNEGRSFVQGLN